MPDPDPAPAPDSSQLLPDPALDPDRLIPQLTPELQSRIPAQLLRLYVEGDTLAAALPRLRETYCGTIAYEIEHIASHEERVWLRQVIESWQHRAPLAPEERKRLLRQFEKRLYDDEVHFIMGFQWHRIVPHLAKVHGWTITPSHFLNQQLDTVWLSE